MVFLGQLSDLLCITTLLRVYLFYGMRLKWKLSSLLVVLGKGICYLVTFSLSAWRNFLLVSMMLFIVVFGFIYASLKMVLNCLIFYSWMTFSFLQRQRCWKLELLPPFWTILVGLKINLTKSHSLYSSKIPQAKINQVTFVSSVRCTTSLDKYLGFPILKGMAKRLDYNFILEKMQTRMIS